MDDIEDLRRAHDALVDLVRNLRADVTAHRMLNDAMLIAMSGNARQALEHNFAHLSEQWLAGALARSTDPSDRTVHAVQRSVEHIRARLGELRHS